KERLSLRKYYQYITALRMGFNAIHRAAKLTQQFFIDAYLKAEANELNYIRTHQQEIRGEELDTLRAAVDEGSDEQAGHIVLPKSFAAGPRAHYFHYLDCMTIFSCKGEPTYFITLTFNPKWPELEQFLNGRPYTDRPDIVERIFQQKRDLFLEAIIKFEVLGKVPAYCWTEEWQKRYLPHIHLLLAMAEASRPRTPEEVERVITCELADPESHPRLFELQAKCMMHSCGTPENPLACSVSGSCKYGYPHKFCDSTQLRKGAYPLWKRRDQGRSYTGAGGREFTNRDLLPTNPWLILLAAAHVFFELCIGFTCIKYVNKYINKGPDMATLGLQVEEEAEQKGRDEPKEFVSSRYICATESFARLNECSVYGTSHTVQTLKLHLQGKQKVHFVAGEEIEAVERAESQRTELEAFFQL
ncbi:unnamed protein product, partial [Heterosigma akashiwo]